MKKYIYFILPIVLVVLILNGCQVIECNTKENSLELTELNYNDIKDKLIRFHVIANSDTDEDQNLKLKVRDKVVEKLCPIDNSTRGTKEYNLNTCKASIIAGIIESLCYEMFDIGYKYGRNLESESPRNTDS